MPETEPDIIDAEIVESNDPDWKPTAKILRGRSNNRRGSKGLLNFRLTRAICNLAKKGLHKTEIAALVGISVSTLNRWLDERQTTGAVYDELRTEFAKAEAEDIQSRIDRIGEAAKDDPKHWKADAWYLERRYPLKFGERKQITHKAAQQGLTQEQFEALTPGQQDEYDAMLQRMEQFLMLTAGDEDDGDE